MAVIDIYTFISGNSADYAELLYISMEKFKSDNHTINYKCIMNSDRERDPCGWNVIDRISPTTILGGNHAVVLNKAIGYIENKYNVFIDSDMCILCPDWDEILIKELTINQVWGVEYPLTSTRYNSFPTTRMFCFDSGILDKIKLDFAARRVIEGHSHSRSIVDKEYADYFNLPEGSVVSYDTGWMLPVIIKQAGIKHGYIKCVYMDSNDARLPIETWIRKKYKRYAWEQSEWHYGDDIYVTHKQAGRKKSLSSCPNGTLWKSRIDQYTQEKFGFKLYHKSDGDIEMRKKLTKERLLTKNSRR